MLAGASPLRPPRAARSPDRSADPVSFPYRRFQKDQIVYSGEADDPCSELRRP